MQRLEPFDTAEAWYIFTGLHGEGYFRVCVSGETESVPGDILVRDREWVGGLKVEVKGWEWPRGPLKKYTVCAVFPGEPLPRIVVQGSNKTVVVEVTMIPYEEAEEFLTSLSDAG